MKRKTSAILALLACLMIFAVQASEPSIINFGRWHNNQSSAIVVPKSASFEVVFAPSKQAEDSIVRFIQEARSSIHVSAYSFTSSPISQALVASYRKGVDVRVVVDKSNLSAKYTAATFLANQKVPVRVDSMYAIQHQKVIIVDGTSVEMGSYNFSASARDRNSENVNVIRGMPELAARYEANWQKMWDESKPLPSNY